MVEDFTPTNGDDGTDAKVFVNGTRVPAGNVDIHWRREGDCSMTSYAEAEIVSPYNGVDYANAFRGLNPSEQNAFDVIRIAVRDYETGQFFTQFHGLVTGVGNSSGASRVFTTRAQGLGQFPSNVEASVNFESEQGIAPDTVLGYIEDELTSLAPSNFSVGQFTETESVDVNDSDNLTPIDVLLSSNRTFITDQGNIWTSKSFTANRHTVADVITWFENKTNTRLFFAPTFNGAAIGAVVDASITTHDAHYLDGDIRIVENDAFAELRPVNSLVGKGAAQRSLENDDSLFGVSATKQYARVLARHDGLYRRSGQTRLVPQTQYESDAENKGEVIKETKRALARAIEDTTGGDMVTLQRAPLFPFDRINAKPTCDQQTGTNTKPITYEVDRVHHKLRGGQHSTCTLNVGVKVDPTEDITVVEEGWEDA